MGSAVGDSVGIDVGIADGSAMGSAVGNDVGWTVGAAWLVPLGLASARTTMSAATTTWSAPLEAISIGSYDSSGVATSGAASALGSRAAGVAALEAPSKAT